MLKSRLCGVTLGIFLVAALPPAVGFSLPSQSDRTLTELEILLAKTGGREEIIRLFDRALELAEAIEEREAKIETLAYIADRLAVSGFRDRAEALFDRAEALFDRAVVLSKQKSADFDSHYYEDRALRIVAVQMAETGYRDRALEEANNIISPLARAEVFNAVATVLIEENELEKAKELLLEAVKVAKTETETLSHESNRSCENLRYALFVQLADNFSRVSDLQSALSFAEKVQGCHTAFDLGFPFQQYQTEAYLRILHNIETIDALRETWRSARGMIDRFETITVWGAIARKFIKIEKYDSAMSIAERLIDPSHFDIDETDPEIENFLSWRQALLMRISWGFVDKGQFKQAENVIELISKPPPVNVSIMVEIAIAQKLHQEEKIEEALERLFDLSSKYLDESYAISDEQFNIPQLQSSIIVAFAEVGAEEKALQLVNSLSELSSRDLALTNLSFHFVTQGNFEKVLQLISELEEQSGIFVPAILRALAPTITQLEHLDRALKLIKDTQPFKEQVQEKIGLQFLKLGEVERGYHIINSLQGEDLDPETVEEASSQLLKQGETEKALNLIQKIESPAIAAQILANLGFHLAEAQ